jgi:hypothetical protein
LEQTPTLDRFPFSIKAAIGDWGTSAFGALLQEYSGRRLTYQSDALAAISGILSRISRVTSDEFIFGQPKVAFARNLLWTSTSAVYRTGFPSWSWLGWRGHISFPMWLEDAIRFPGGVNIYNLEMTEADTYFTSEPRFLQVVDYPAANADPPVLRVTSQTVKLTVVRVAAVGEEYVDKIGEVRDVEEDMWCVEGHHEGVMEPLSPCDHFGASWRYSSDQCCFRTGPENTARLEMSGEVQEFLLVVQWQEMARVGGSDKWVPCHRDFFTEDGLGNVVMAMLILPESNGIYVRGAVLPISSKAWDAASPVSSTVELV